MSKSNENDFREGLKKFEGYGIEKQCENLEQVKKPSLESEEINTQEILEKNKKEDQKDVLNQAETGSLFNKTLFRDEPDIQIQELEDTQDNFNPLTDSLYSVRTPRSGESINFKNLISSDLMRRIEEGSPIKVKKSKKLSEKENLVNSEEEEEGKSKDKEQHSLFYKNNPQWKISNETLNYIQKKEPSSDLDLIDSNQNSHERATNFKNSVMKMDHNSFNNYDFVKNINEKKFDNLENTSPQKELYENNSKINPYKDQLPLNFNPNINYLSNSDQKNWNPSFNCFPNFNNFTDNHIQDSPDDDSNGNTAYDYGVYPEAFLKTPFNSSEHDGNGTPQNCNKPHMTFEEFLKIKYQGKTPPKYNLSKINSTLAKNYLSNNKFHPHENQQYYKKESPNEDYDYCSSSTHSTITKKLSPFEDVSFYPKNFYSFTPNLKSHSKLRTDDSKTNLYRIPEEKANIKGDQQAHPQYCQPAYFSNNNIGNYSQNTRSLLIPKTQNLKNLNKLEKLNDCNFNLKGSNQNYTNFQNNLNHENNFNPYNFSMGRIYPGQSSPTNNYFKSKTHPSVICTKPPSANNINNPITSSVNSSKEDCTKSPLSVNLNINKIKKNANINNLTNLSSNLAKLSSNISHLNNLTHFSGNLPNFENISELNKLIEMNKDANFSFDKDSPPMTPQNTPQYRNFQNGKSGWICSSCKNFNYEIRIKCNRCGKPQMKNSIMLPNSNKSNSNNFTQNESSPDENICNYNINNDVCKNASNDYKDLNKDCKKLINVVNKEYDSNENSSESTSPKNGPLSNETASSKPNSADSKKKKKPFVERVGDWVCIKCKNLNFSFRVVCNRCQLSKTESEKLFEQYMKNLMNYVKINELLQNQIMTNQNLITGSNLSKVRPKAKQKGHQFTQDDSSNSKSVLFKGEEYFDEASLEEVLGKNNPK